MESRILYDDIKLPSKVSDILRLDFWILEHVHAPMVKTVKNPVKFSAYTSIFVHSGSCCADINLLSHKIEGPCIVNVHEGDIVLPREVSDDFDASFMVLSRRLDDSICATIKDVGVFSLLRSHPTIPVDPEGNKLLEAFYANMRSIYNDNQNKHPFETVLFSIVAFFYQHVMKYFDRYALQPGALNNRIADRFLNLARQHFRKERFLDFYADKLDITTKHLSRTVKMQTGTTAVEWLNRFIILEAKVMLRSSNLNIQQIAEELNFPSQSFFGKYFKKATGISPKDYRNSF